MHEIKSHLSESIDRLNEELLEALKLLPNYKERIKHIENNILNENPAYKKSAQAIFSDFIANLFEIIFNNEEQELKDDKNTEMFIYIITGDDDTDEIEASRRLGYGLYLCEALYNLSAAEEELENKNYLSSLRLCNGAFLSKGTMRGHEIGLNDGVTAAKQMASSKARQTKQEKANARKTEIKEWFLKLKKDDPGLSKNKASRKIADEVYLAPEVVRRHLQKL